MTGSDSRIGRNSSKPDVRSRLIRLLRVLSLQGRVETRSGPPISERMSTPDDRRPVVVQLPMVNTNKSPDATLLFFQLQSPDHWPQVPPNPFQMRETSCKRQFIHLSLRRLVKPLTKPATWINLLKGFKNKLELQLKPSKR